MLTGGMSPRSVLDPARREHSEKMRKWEHAKQRMSVKDALKGRMLHSGIKSLDLIFFFLWLVHFNSFWLVFLFSDFYVNITTFLILGLTVGGRHYAKSSRTVGNSPCCLSAGINRVTFRGNDARYGFCVFYLLLMADTCTITANYIFKKNQKNSSLCTAEGQ